MFMNNFTEKTWFLPTVQELTREFMKSYVANPPRKQQSDSYTGPITITNYQQLEDRSAQQLAKDGINLTMPNGNRGSGCLHASGLAAAFMEATSSS